MLIIVIISIMNLRITLCIFLLTCLSEQVRSQRFRFGSKFQDKFRYRAPGNCPSVTVMPDFDKEQYYGRWYEIAKYPVPYEFGQRCITAEYSPFDGPLSNFPILNQALSGNEALSGNIKVVNSGISSIGPFNRDIRIEGWAGVPDLEEMAKLRVTFWTSLLGGAGDGEPNYWILDTDYTNYTTVHSCVQNGDFHTMANWILTRTYEPSNETLATALEVFDNFGIDLDPFETTNRDDCSESYYLDFYDE